jgi:hypothetical protein
MITYILYRNSKHTFENIKNPVFIFGPSDLANKEGLGEIRDKLEEILDRANQEEDMIVLNGPSYLTAIAGMIWLTQPDRKYYNILAYSPELKAYIPYTDKL